MSAADGPEVGEVTQAGSLGGPKSWSRAVDGQVVVGAAQTANGAVRAFARDLRSDGMQDLGTLGGRASGAWDVDGDVVVGSSLTPANKSHAFSYRLSKGRMRDLGTLGGAWSRAFAVSGDLVAGVSQVPGGASHAFAFDLRTATRTDLGTLGGSMSEAVAVDGDVVVGTSWTAADRRHAFAYDMSKGRMRDLGTLGGAHSEAVAVDNGVVVGWAETATGTHAFAYELARGTMRDLGTLGGRDSRATALDGTTVVGHATLPGDVGAHAFAYDLAPGSGGMKDLGVLEGHRSSVALGVDGDVVIGMSGMAGSSYDVDPVNSLPVVYHLPSGTVDRLSMDGWGDSARVVGISGGVVAGDLVQVDWDHIEEELVEGLSRAAAWSLGPAFLHRVMRVQEDAGSVPLEVTRTVATNEPAVFEYALRSGTGDAVSDVSLPSGTVTLAPSQSRVALPLVVIDDTVRESAETVVVSLRAVGGTALGAPTSTTVVLEPSDQQPDGLVSLRSDGRYVGGDVYDPDAAGQVRRRRVARGKAGSFYVRVANDGNARNTFTVRGSDPVPGSRLRYFSGGEDVTARMRSNRGLRMVVRAGEYRQVRVRIAVAGTAQLGSRKSAVVSATWTGDGSRSDAVKAVAFVVR